MSDRAVFLVEDLDDLRRQLRSFVQGDAPAIGPLPPNTPGPPSVGMFARRASKLLGWWMRGLNRPTPFFDDRTKAPRAVPRKLTASERAAL